MNYNYSKLNGKIVEKLGKQSEFARAMNLSEHTISKKLNNEIDFKQCEIVRACEVLGIAAKDIPAYFFTLDVQ